MKTDLLDQFLTEKDVAQLYNVSIATVRRWRLLRLGPVYRKFGKAVRYSMSDVQAWVASRAQGGDDARR